MSCEWGRIGAKKFRRKVEVFNSIDEAMAQIKRIESLRMALLHKLRFRHKLPLPDNGLKDTLSDWRTQMSETV